MTSLTAAETACLTAFRSKVAREYEEEFGLYDRAQIDHVAEAWFRIDARHDHRVSELRRKLPRARQILDVASGMGTFTLRALSLGYEAHGIEPDSAKLALTSARIDAGGLPNEWKRRFSRARGEALPYRNASFDCVLSYQTLEHVADPAAVIAEMLRVVRPGGGLHLRCPDYRGTYEAHYRLPWLPLCPRSLARAWLRLRGRPLKGLDGIRYTTQPRITAALREAAERAGIAITISDLEAERLRARLRARRLPSQQIFVRILRLALWLRRLFREESQINLWVAIESKRVSEASEA